ncbi:hypothetical protein KUV57_11235 [Epibacterium sp. DP7N7-1]|nr:hypothetical protein [Epibacterium sp. DP7N7-1]
MHHMTTARAALSTDAIKVAAKALNTSRPRAAIRAAMRHDAPGHPMEMAAEDHTFRSIPSGVTWLHGGEGYDLAPSRSVQMQLTLSAIDRGRVVIWRTIGGSYAGHGVTIGSNAFRLDIAPEPPDPDAETVMFIERRWANSPSSDDRKLIEIIDSYRENPRWSVLVFDPVGPKGLHRSIARPEDTRISLFRAPASAPGVTLAQIGEGTIPFRLDRDRCGDHPLGRIKMMERAIRRLEGEVVAPTHTGRLEQVSRAFGFRSWHAAEGRGKSS